VYLKQWSLTREGKEFPEMSEPSQASKGRMTKRRGPPHVTPEKNAAEIIESMSDAFITIDREWCYRYANRAAERIVGLSREQMLGRSVLEFFPGQVTEIERACRRAMDEGVTTRFEEYYAPLSIWLEQTVSASEDGINVNARDITERKQAQEELQKAYDELEQRVEEHTFALTEMNAVLQEEIRQRKRMEAERERLLHRIVVTQEEERRRIAREMHDQLGQQLSLLTIKLAALKTAHAASAELSEQLDDLEAIARQLDADVDFLIWEVRPTALDDLGLIVALRDYLQSWSKHFGIHAELHTSRMDRDRLTDEIETALYRVTQEALTNIAKHARAQHVDILLARRPDHVSLIIEDDGVGFESEQAFGTGESGFGLIGLRERASLFGGTLEIESRPGRGTTLIVRIPAARVADGMM
jgi:PAS domain S-box-containing protein